MNFIDDSEDLEQSAIIVSKASLIDILERHKDRDTLIPS